jgi:hypothetical protein
MMPDPHATATASPHRGGIDRRHRTAPRPGSPLLAAIAACALVAGCATPPTAPVSDTMLDKGLGGRVVTLPSIRERIVQIAEQEWTLWARRGMAAGAATDPGTPPAFEHDPPYTTRVLLYWNSFSDPATALRRLRYPDGSLQPWSAVFISFVMRSAGVPERAFPPSARHWDYIHHARMAPRGAGVIALDARTHTPRSADLACAPRGDTVRRVSHFDDLLRPDSNGTYHCDIVVDVGNGVAHAIGGNIGNSVTRLRLPLDASGRLLRSAERPWLVLLRPASS